MVTTTHLFSAMTLRTSHISKSRSNTGFILQEHEHIYSFHFFHFSSKEMYMCSQNHLNMLKTESVGGIPPPTHLHTTNSMYTKFHEF